MLKFLDRFRRKKPDMVSEGRYFRYFTVKMETVDGLMLDNGSLVLEVDKDDNMLDDYVAVCVFHSEYYTAAWFNDVRLAAPRVVAASYGQVIFVSSWM